MISSRTRVLHSGIHLESDNFSGSGEEEKEV